MDGHAVQIGQSRHLTYRRANGFYRDQQVSIPAPFFIRILISYIFYIRKKFMTRDDFISMLDYDKFTGLFLWKKGHRKGMVAGYKHPHGYKQIWIFGKPYYAHRLAWLFVYGEFPTSQIDHRDGVKDNNAIENLRDVSVNMNMQNQKIAHRNNKSSLLGVSTANGKWRARIKIMGKVTHIGTFETPELAHAAYLNMKRKFHEGCLI